MGRAGRCPRRRSATRTSGTLTATVAGISVAPAHRPDELRGELAEAGFGDVGLVAVEGFAWLLGDLEAQVAEPGPLLHAVRLTESEPSMLGCSGHVIGVGTRLV